MDLNARTSIAGRRGLVGSAILRNRQARSYTNEMQWSKDPLITSRILRLATVGAPQSDLLKGD